MFFNLITICATIQKNDLKPLLLDIHWHLVGLSSKLQKLNKTKKGSPKKTLTLTLNESQFFYLCQK